MESSSFGNETNHTFAFTDIIPLYTNGATSDTYKVLIYGKWHFLKRPKREFVYNAKYLSAFQKEFEIGYLLDHPNISKYIFKGEDTRGFYILLDFVDGLTLSEFIKLNPYYFSDSAHLSKFVNQLLSALKYIHEKQILHLDLKPDNILITAINKDIKLIDFGFSYTDCFSNQSIGRTELYAAPEQLEDGDIDQRTDIYGFGKILEFIFDKSEIKLPRIYNKLIKRCLQYNKSDRFKNVDAISNYIQLQQKRKRAVVGMMLLFIALIITGVILQHKPEKKIAYESIILHENNGKSIGGLKEDSIGVKDNPGKNEINENFMQQPKDTNSVLYNIDQELEELVSNNFKNLYDLFDGIDNDNYQLATKIYSEAVDKSFALTDTIADKYSNMDIGVIANIVRAKLDRHAALYLSWLNKYGIERTRIFNESIAIDSLKQDK